jgi:hypothetical protein
MGVGDVAAPGKPHQVKLTEGYQDRVDQVSQAVIRYSQQTPVRPEQVVALIDRYAQAAHISDWMLGGKSRRDFVKDVTVALKGQLKWAVSAKGKTAAQKALKTLASWLAQDLEHELGNMFPDGDPHDALDAVIRRAIRSGARGSESWSKQYLGNPELDLEWLRDTMLGPSNYQDLHDFMWHTVAPEINRAFAADHDGQDPHAYLALMWDSWRADARSDAKMKGKAALDQFDSQHARNPYR